MSPSNHSLTLPPQHRNKRIAAAMAALRAGRCIVVSDSQNRENEGDVIAAGEKITANHVNFMMKHCRGLICVAMTQQRLAQLAIPLMQPQRPAHTPMRTHFTVSVDHRSVTTGISAAERAATILALAQTKSKKSDFLIPGHVFPIAAAKNIAQRSGHTEAGVYLMQCAGLMPAAVICEIINPDGTMARSRELKKFATKHRLKMLTIQELILYYLSEQKFLTPQKHYQLTAPRPPEITPKTLNKPAKSPQYTTPLPQVHYRPEKLSLAVYPLAKLLLPKRPIPPQHQTSPTPSRKLSLFIAAWSDFRPIVVQHNGKTVPPRPAIKGKLSAITPFIWLNDTHPFTHIAAFPSILLKQRPAHFLVAGVFPAKILLPELAKLKKYCTAPLKPHTPNVLFAQNTLQNMLCLTHINPRAASNKKLNWGTLAQYFYEHSLAAQLMGVFATFAVTTILPVSLERLAPPGNLGAAPRSLKKIPPPPQKTYPYPQNFPKKLKIAFDHVGVKLLSPAEM